MGFVRKLGFGKKEPHKVPREVSVLRTKIEAENRENFPHLARYKALVQEAAQVYAVLDAEIAKKVYAEEAAKLSEDIRKRLDGLADKIRKNTQEAKAEGGQDYVESNIDYLARKSLRNSAKSLFTEFLEGQERFTSCLQETKPECADILDASADAMIRVAAELSNNYFKKHGDDREIAELKELVLTKFADIDRAYSENSPRIRDTTMAAAIEPQVMRLRVASRELSLA